MGAHDKIEDGDDDVGCDQGYRLFDDDFEIHEPVAGDRVGKSQGYESLEDDGELSDGGRDLSCQKRDDVKDSKGDDAKAKPVYDPSELLFENEIGRSESVI